MSVAEMKVKAMNHLVQLENESAVQAILAHLEKLTRQENESRADKIDAYFDEAVKKYDTVLKKLAE